MMMIMLTDDRAYKRSLCVCVCVCVFDSCTESVLACSSHLQGRFNYLRHSYPLVGYVLVDFCIPLLNNMIAFGDDKLSGEINKLSI